MNLLRLAAPLACLALGISACDSGRPPTAAPPGTVPVTLPGYSARLTARENHRFLRTETNYLTKREIREHVLRHFDQCDFVEEAAFPGRRYAFFRRFPHLLPAYRAWFSETRGRVLVCRGAKRQAGPRPVLRVA
jgi:hypothetical protein